MRVNKVINNNIVSALDSEGKEIVVMTWLRSKAWKGNS